jgi:hypothetical protein
MTIMHRRKATPSCANSCNEGRKPRRSSLGNSVGPLWPGPLEGERPWNGSLPLPGRAPAVGTMRGKYVRIEMAGKKFGRLTVVSLDSTNRLGAMWLCICECGNKKIILGCRLRSGCTKSCGCLVKELNKVRAITHRLSGSRSYDTWNDMIKRCFNQHNKRFKNYGGRGISVCRRWLKFDNFYADMGAAPCGLQLDRINNDGNYSKSNCRWATPRAQSNNRSTNRTITMHNKTMTLVEWSREIGISQNTIWYRLARGWTIERALTK